MTRVSDAEFCLWLFIGGTIGWAVPVGLYLLFGEPLYVWFLTRPPRNQ